jgi:hypothetical protein
MRDLTYLRTVQELLRAARAQTRAAWEKGSSLQETQRTLTLEDWRARVAGDEKWASTLFRQFFLGPVVARLYEEARSGKLE